MKESEFYEKLKEHGQEHVVKYYEKQDDETKRKLVSQVLGMDFDELKELYELTKTHKTFDDIKVEPILAQDASKLSEEEREELIKNGEDIIKSKKFAVIMMAGGQGTRLGHTGPKGTFDFGLENHKTIFETFVDQFKKAKEQYGVAIPWYIMTSKDNNQETIEFFYNNDYFGYEEGIKTFFSQNEIPMLDENGKVIMDENGLIKEAANGHGGVFEALVKNGILDQLKQAGIEWVFTCGVDNIIANLIDPLLLGYSAKHSYMATSVSCIKENPDERVGMLCYKNGKPSVVEYTELTDDLRYARKDNGELVLSEAHIMMNLFNCSVISDIAKEKLPYHVAHKKCNIVNEDGSVFVPEVPNAYKFETFIFDAFERLSEIGVLRYKREDCFAPIKNATGNDSPETARALYLAKHTKA